jgi:hypothetical protein
MKKILVYLFIIFVGNFSFAQERFLPVVESDAISITSRQDGQAIYVYISNKSSMVLTYADIICHEKPNLETNNQSQKGGKYSSFLPPPPEEPKNNKLKPAPSEKFYTPKEDHYSRLVPLVEKAKGKYSGRLLPGTAEEIYLETKSISDLGSCYLSNNRGRVKHFYEIF